MSLLKKLFGTLAQKPWEENQAAIDNTHSGRTFNLSNQMSAVIIIFGVSTAIFSLIFTGYLYSIPPEQDTTFILKTYLLWINTLVLIFVTFFFNKNLVGTPLSDSKILTSRESYELENLKLTSSNVLNVAPVLAAVTDAPAFTFKAYL